MKFLASRRKLVVFAATSVVLIVGVGSVIYWQIAKNHQADKTDKDAAFYKALQDKHQVIINKANEINTAKQKEYDALAGITTAAQFEAKVPANEREGKALLVLKHMVDDKKYPEALKFIDYIESTYPKVANYIDFTVYAYNSAKSANKPDLMTKYKKRAETILRATGSLKPNENLSDDYFGGEG